MSEQQYKRYLMLHIFAENYRKFIVTSPKLSEEKFRVNMQIEHYVSITCDDKINKKDVLILLLDKSSKYANSGPDLKKLLKSIKGTPNVIIISYKPFKNNCTRVINSFTYLNIKAYTHEIFDIELPKGPLCFPHRILSEDECNRVLQYDLCCRLNNLPKILESDPIIIWIGGVAGNIIEITSISPITGYSIQYRVVIQSYSNIIFQKKNVVQNNAEEPEDVDDETIIQQEMINENLSDKEDNGDEDETAP